MLATDLPREFVHQMKYLLGNEAVTLFSALDNSPPLRGVRLHRWTADEAAPIPEVTKPVAHPYALSTPMPVPGNVLERLGEPVPWMKDGFYVPSETTLGKTIYHEAGAFYMQEPSAMAVATALQVQPGERVLDLCAAPGGKTTALARSMRGEGVLVANEIHPKRVVTLAQNIERLGIPAVVVNESPQALAQAWPGYFDAVLVDAPCSGEGMFRKDEIARREWTADAPQVCAIRQREILASATTLVRPGGRLVYSTCTLNPIENEQVVAWALSQLPLQLEPLPDWPGWSAGRPEWADDMSEVALTRRLWPHIGQGEGHFVAAFRVTEEYAMSGLETRETHKARSPKRTSKRARSGSKSGSESDEWFELAEQLFLEVPLPWQRVTRHKDLLFSAPPNDLETDGLKVLRPGVCLAEATGKRLQPHHSLAMAAHPDLVRNKTELQPQQAVEYMSGLSLEATVPSGWNMMFTTGGLPVGWGKGVPGRINNLYPRGLRRQGLSI